MRFAAVISLAVMAVAAAGCTTVGPGADGASAQVEATPDVVGTVVRDGDEWTLEYVFNQASPVWAFHRSSLLMDTREPWRPRDWRVETPGVVLERVGSLDVLRSVDGGPVPGRVRLKMTPSGDDLEADYQVLIFTDGSVATPAGQFSVFPMASLEAARTAEGDINDIATTEVSRRMIFSDRSGQVLYEGARWDSVTVDGDGGYVLFGQAQMREGEQLVTVVDPQLPEWISASLEDFAPRAVAYYSERLGEGQTSRPTIIASWRGPTRTHTGLSGSVLPGTIVMSFEGAELLNRSDQILAQNRWFIGHEAAHFWLGQTVAYERARDSWITEGGADLMAIRALKSIDPAYDARRELQREVDDCIRLADDPINTVAERGEHRARYACGAVFAMAAESLQHRKDGGDWFDWLKGLIHANREDKIVTAEEWLDHLDAVGGSTALRAQIEELLTQGSSDTKAAVAAILREGGVAHRIEGDRVVLE